VAKSFHNEFGNISYQRIEHTWDDEDVPIAVRARKLWIAVSILKPMHTLYTHRHIRNWMDEQMEGRAVDVIIGNPPYQMTGSGGDQTTHPSISLFVQQAMKLEPRSSHGYPIKMDGCGRGLSDFRAEF